jgi:hypothetical protein
MEINANSVAASAAVQPVVLHQRLHQQRQVQPRARTRSRRRDISAPPLRRETHTPRSLRRRHVGRRQRRDLHPRSAFAGCGNGLLRPRRTRPCALRSARPRATANANSVALRPCCRRRRQRTHCMHARVAATRIRFRVRRTRVLHTRARGGDATRVRFRVRRTRVLHVRARGGATRIRPRVVRAHARARALPEGATPFYGGKSRFYHTFGSISPIR